MISLSILKECSLCGGGFRTAGSEMCPWCWRTVERWVRTTHSRLPLSPGLSVRYSMSWSPHEPRKKVDILHALKGQSCAKTLARWALLFQCHHGPVFARPPVWVPIPGHNGLADDHAARWAAALKWAYGGVVCRLLQRKKLSDLEQKELDRSGRNQIEFESLELSKSLHLRPLVLVDDVVTTGATARAAYRALNIRVPTEIWVLAYRQTLRN